jgi:hypothetical protein
VARTSAELSVLIWRQFLQTTAGFNSLPALSGHPSSTALPGRCTDIAWIRIIGEERPKFPLVIQGRSGTEEKGIMPYPCNCNQSCIGQTDYLIDLTLKGTFGISDWNVWAVQLWRSAHWIWYILSSCIKSATSLPFQICIPYLEEGEWDVVAS